MHCLGPVYGRDEPSDELLARCYRRALALADEDGVSSIAFPAISTGAFGYPMGEAAEIALRTVLQAAPELQTVRHVRVVLYSASALTTHEEVLEALTADLDGVERRS